MHVGATIRLLRLGAGIGLRDLAERIGVSSAYLSRVENGRDAPPTADRLEAIARELALPPALLLEVAGRVSPFLSSYMREVPAASALFVDIARRNLDAEAIARVREVLERELPAPREPSAVRRAPPLPSLLAPGRVVLGLSAARVSDVLDVLAARLGEGSSVGTKQLAESMRERERESSTLIGGGVMVPQAFAPGPPLAALVVLRRPLAVEAPDGEKLRVAIAVRASERGHGHLAQLAEVARLSAHGGVELLCRARTADEALAVLTGLR